MTALIVRAAALVATVAVAHGTAMADPCFAIDAQSHDGVQGDVPQTVRLSPAGMAALGSSPHAYVEVARTGSSDVFVRLMDADAAGRRETTFSFSREGMYELRGYRRDGFSWPVPAWPARIDPGNASHPIVMVCDPLRVAVPKIERRADFEGVRGQWWVAYRAGTAVEGGASVFFGRFGLAGLAEMSIPRIVRRDLADINRVVPGAEVRWRGAKGYLGAGVRYFPDEQPDRDRLRFAFVGGQELPSFRGLPVWMLLDLRLDEVRPNVIKGLRPAFGFRIDLWGSRE